MNRQTIIQGEVLDKGYEFTRRPKKHKKIKAGTMMRKTAEWEKLTKIDSMIIRGFEDNSILKPILEASNFTNEKKIWSSKLFNEGKVAITYMKLNGKYKIFFADIVGSPLYQHGEIQRISISNGSVDFQTEQPIVWEYRVNEDGKIVYNKKIKNAATNDYESVVEEMLDLPYIPVWIIKDNPFAKNPWDQPEVKEMLEELDALSGDLGDEWELVKTQLYFNGASSQGKNKDIEMSKILDGQRALGGNLNKNSAFAGPDVEPFPMTSSGPMLLMNHINYVKDLVYQHIFSSRETDMSATNKVNAQIVKSDRGAFEYNELCREQRAHDYYMFYTRVLKYQIANLRDDVNIYVEMNEFDRNIYEIENRISHENTLLKAQAKQQNAQAKLIAAKTINEKSGEETTNTGIDKNL